MLISLTIPMIIPTTSRREVTFSFIQTHETNLIVHPQVGWFVWNLGTPYFSGYGEFPKLKLQ